ncbi:ABC transporter substrate-binding protein [Nocardia sp. NPDC051750]|uniref:ABC transporter substrate-binding protein n=1 Tax=Nocardia sp. NPDC051750 TaxID=3364325 RepID=UPI0037A7988C
MSESGGRPLRFHALRGRAAGVIAALAVGALVLAGCSTPTGAETSSITVAQPMDLKSPDPVIDNSLYSTNIFRSVFDQLNEVMPDGSLAPRLATGWTASGDARTWTFPLRRDSTFHDGTPVTAADVVFSFQAVMGNPRSLNRIYTNNIENVAADRQGGVVFTLKKADAAFPRIAYYISIVPQQYYERVGPEGFADNPIGSGPYRFVSWTPGVSVELTSYPEYWGGAPSIRNVTVLPVADPEARINGLLAGDIDLTSLTPAQISAVQGAAEPVEKQANQLVYLSGNAEAGGPLADQKLRNAISMAIDRTTIIDTVLYGYGAVASGSAVAPDVEGYDGSLAPLDHDIAEATRLVAESNYRGTPIPLDYPTDGNVPMSNQLAQAVAAQLSRIGIRVELRGSDAASFDLKWTSHEFRGLYLSQFSPSMMDASTTLNYLFGPTGNALFSDPEIDALIVQAGTTVDERKRRAVMSEIWLLNQQRSWVINLDYTVSTYGKTIGLRWQPRADGHVDWRTASWQ